MGLGIGRIFYHPWVDTGRPDVHVLIFGMEQPIWSNVTSCFQIRHAMFLGSVTLFCLECWMMFREDKGIATHFIQHHFILFFVF